MPGKIKPFTKRSGWAMPAAPIDPIDPADPPAHHARERSNLGVHGYPLWININFRDTADSKRIVNRVERAFYRILGWDVGYAVFLRAFRKMLPELGPIWVEVMQKRLGGRFVTRPASHDRRAIQAFDEAMYDTLREAMRLWAEAQPEHGVHGGRKRKAAAEGVQSDGAGGD